MLCLGAGGALRAQQPAFSGVIRGVLIECDDPGPAGEFSLRAKTTNQVYRFRFDGKTYVEREEQRVSMQRLEKGEYGICEDCGEEIGIERLKARPVTTLCISCKSSQEMAERKAKRVV